MIFCLYMNVEKKNYAIEESQMLVLNKKDFENNRFIFPNVCECACLVLELENDKVILYHKHLIDSINDIKLKLSDHLKDTKIKSATIFGGNVNNIMHANENNAIQVGIYTSTYKEISNYFKYNLNIASSGMMFALKESDAELFQIDHVETIEKDKDKILQYDINNRNEFDNKELMCYIKDLPDKLSFKPKYENICGPENLEKLRIIISDLGFDRNKIKEMRTPNGANIKVFYNNGNIDIKLSKTKKYELLEKTQKCTILYDKSGDMSPKKSGYKIQSFTL